MPLPSTITSRASDRGGNDERCDQHILCPHPQHRCASFQNRDQRAQTIQTNRRRLIQFAQILQSMQERGLLMVTMTKFHCAPRTVRWQLLIGDSDV